mmetsp:Transcript_837/g.615  ORF Transcript_837/g.615 Transcript_837/m.615 type:complete len:86 (-) Transcript_837:112-369(-)
MPTKLELHTIVNKAFEKHDKEMSGCLEREEVKKVLDYACAELGASAITDAQLDEIIKTVDDDGDGKYMFDELFKVIGPILEQQLA